MFLRTFSCSCFSSCRCIISFATTFIVCTADLLLIVSIKQPLQYTSYTLSIRNILCIRVSAAFSFCKTKCISLLMVLCMSYHGSLQVNGRVFFFFFCKVLNNLKSLSAWGMVIAWLHKATAHHLAL